MAANSEGKKELSPYVRGQIIALSSVGLSAYQISQQLSIPRRTVRSTIDKNPEREDGKSKPRSGRPAVLTKHDIRRLLSIVKAEPSITCPQLRVRLGVTASPRTLSSALKSYGYTLHRNVWTLAPAKKVQPEPRGPRGPASK